MIGSVFTYQRLSKAVTNLKNALYYPLIAQLNHPLKEVLENRYHFNLKKLENMAYSVSTILENYLERS